MIRDISRTMVASVLAQAAGVGKSVLIAYYFGLSAELDGYYLAQAIPVTLAAILVGFVQTGFIPRYSAALAQDRAEDASRLAGSMLSLLGGVSLALSVLLAAAASLIVPTITARGTGIDEAALVSLRVLAFLVLLNGLADAYALLLNAHSRFAAPALAPAANALVATALLAAVPHWGLANLLAGTIAGLLVQTAILWWIGRHAGITIHWRRSGELREAMQAGRSFMPALLFSNLTLLVPTAAASHLGEGAVAALSMAMRFHLAATHAAAIAVSSVLLPRFASALALRRPGDVKAMLRGGFPFAIAIGIGCVVWIGVAGPEFVRLLLQRGAFDEKAAALVSTSWLWLSIAVFPSVWGTALAKALQAMQLGRQLSALALFGMLAASVTAVAASATGSFVLLSSALPSALVATTIGCAWCVNRALGRGGQLESHVQSGAAVVALAVALASILQMVGPLPVGPWGVLVASSLFIAIAAALLLGQRRMQIRSRTPP